MRFATKKKISCMDNEAICTKFKFLLLSFSRCLTNYIVLVCSHLQFSTLFDRCFVLMTKLFVAILKSFTVTVLKIANRAVYVYGGIGGAILGY